ncbi:GNAT family N-acetyltransferase [Lacticigenium naphthae]|uniref:GNAT family N-acetyltransferase n=1 Tax=Lacticigenium naphthae TaxID=515351 RepID=UPI00041CF299|nr:GNAT family protein [Lacticigenium naphthae]
MTKEEIEIRIKEADKSDAKELLIFIQKMSEQSSFVIFPSLDEEITVEQEVRFIEQFLHSKNDLLLISLSQNDIIGLVTIRAQDREEMKHVGELGIVVDQEYWGFGLGSALVEEAIHWSSNESDLVRLEVEVQEPNKRALHLYEKAGFEQEGHLKKRVKVKTDYVDTIMMALIVK